MSHHEMPYPVSGAFMTLLLAVLIIGVLGAVGTLAGAVVPGSIIRFGAGAIGLVAAFITVYALTWDTYYNEGMSRWEHAGRWNAQAAVIGALMVAGACALAAGLPRWQRFRAVPFVLEAIGCVALVVAWGGLTAGH